MIFVTTSERMSPICSTRSVLYNRSRRLNALITFVATGILYHRGLETLNKPDMVVVSYTQTIMLFPTAAFAPINPRAGPWAKAPANNGVVGTSSPGCSSRMLSAPFCCFEYEIEIIR